MINKYLRHVLLISISGMHLFCVHGSSLITGDPAAPAGMSFSFPIGTHAYNTNSGALYVGSAVTVADQSVAAPFTLSVAEFNGAQFSPLLTATTATINNVENQPNILRGQGFGSLALLGLNPVVTRIDEQQDTVYILKLGSTTTLLSTPNKDANGDAGGTIVALATVERTPSNSDERAVALLSPGMMIFTAIAPASQPFGTVGSGIGINVCTATSATTPCELAFLTTVPLNHTSPQLAINQPLSNMAPEVTLCSTKITPIFVGVSTTSAAIAGAGSYSVAILVGATQKIYSIAANNVIGNDAIIAARTATGIPVTTTAHAICILRSTTGPEYLIVVGGINETPLTQKRLVYALPIISNSGQLANINAPPVTIYQGTTQQFAIRRSFEIPPQTTDDLYTSMSTPAIVGGGMSPGPITQIITSGDTVFITTATADTEDAPGIWYSQALFNASGVIQCWTSWRRAGGTDSAIPLFFAPLDEHSANFWFATGTSSSTISTIQRTGWSNTTGIASRMSQQFQASIYGVQGINDFPRTASMIGVTAYSGLHKIVLVQSNTISDGLIIPQPDIATAPIYTQTDGSLRDFTANAPIISLSGGALDTLGALISTTIVEDETYGWFVVGGSGGIAVLASPDGTGWLLNPGLGENFAGLQSNMTWRCIPFEPNNPIRTITADGAHLYVLTTKSLFRITASPTQFSVNAEPLVVTLATIDTLDPRATPYSNCTDIYIAEPLCILATSIGLFRNGNNTHIETANSPESLSWTPIQLPNSLGPVTQLFSIGPVQDPSSSTQYTNIYLLNAYTGLSQAYIYRLSINSHGVIQTNTVQLFPDQITKNQLSFFFNIGNYRNRMATDGAILAFSRSRYGDTAAYLQIIPPQWHNWPFPFNTTVGIVAAARSVIMGGNSIYGMIRSSASGAWLAPGDRGLMSNE